MQKEEILRLLKKQKFPEGIISAFEKVDREDFVPKELKSKAYHNVALPIGYGQTISQPYTIAFMLSLFDLRDHQKILEIGSGSGYVLALINEISKNSEIYGIERIKSLAEKSIEILKKHSNIKIMHSDGSKGLPGKAPFDRIILSASSDNVPQKLIRQLKVGGVMVAPVRNSIMIVEKQANENKITEFSGFAFVPLIEGTTS